MARHNKIDLGPAIENCVQLEEGIANVAITPGSIVMKSRAADATLGEFILATAAASLEGTQLYVADHNFYAGRQVDDDNPADETMPAHVPLPRKRYAALLLNGQNVTALDTPLKVSATAGVLDIGNPASDRIVAYAREVFNNSGSNPELIAVRMANI